MKKITLAAIVLMITASAVFAGGPLIIFDLATRTPYAYPGPVNVYTDLGPNGVMTNAESDANTANGYAEWTNVPTASLVAAVAGDFSTVGLPDIDGFNAGLVVGTFNGGGIHVMYDNDGTIVSNFFGAPPGVLGIASPEWSTTGTPDLLESWTVINGSAADAGDVGGATFAGVFTHEFGHTINLAHTQTNGAAGFFGDSNGPDACATPYAQPQTISDFETMYPFLDITPGSTGMYQAVLDHLDDIAAVSDVYPNAGWPATHGTVSGIVYAPDGVTQLTGINVIIRNVADPYKDANSCLSGDYTQGDLGPDGLFTLTGLTPGAQYVLYIDEIVAGGFSTPPGTIPGDGNEEYWNTNEDVDPSIDDPCEWTVIVPTAGVTDNADIIVNGDPNNLDLGDDDYIEIALPWPFPFCGQSYNSVFVGSNGYLTFGQGDTDYSESISEFLNNEPRIAALWDDLNPTAGGTITAGAVGADFVVSYSNVPEFFSTGSNSFDITLRSDGSYDIEYGTITAGDGLAGRTPGGGAVDPGEVDLTVEPQPIGPLAPTVYEYFSGFDNDLDSEFLAYAPCVIPDPPEIVVDPTSLSAILCTGESVTKQLEISNLGDLDLNFAILTNEDLGSPGSGGVIPKLDMGPDGDPADLDQARLAKLNDDIAGSNPGKPEISPLTVPLPHVFALSLLNEDFNSGFPAGWTAIDNEGNGVIWQVPAQGGGNYTGGSGDACGASSDFVGPADYDTELLSPVITGFGPNVVLSYSVNYQNFAAWDYLDVDVSVDGGANWTTVLSWNEDHGGFFGTPGEQVALNLDAYVAGYPSFQVRWHWYDFTTTGDWDWYVQIDDVMVVSDEVLTPCGFISSVAPDMGTIPGDGSQNVDVTFDATGYAPGFYECELIINSNAVNEPRLVVPLYLTVPVKAALDIKPGSCPNPFNRHLFDWLDEAQPNKGGVLPVALVGDADFDVTDVDLSTILLENVAPSTKGGGPKYNDVATPYDNADCNCIGAMGDGIMDISMKFQSLQIAEAIAPGGGHSSTMELTMTGFLTNGLMFVASDCVTFVGNFPPEDPDPVITQDALGSANPNPFNPTTRINYSVANAGQVTLTVFDVRGRVVERLVDGVVGAGEYTITWDAKGLPSGIYFYRLETANFKETKKLVLLK